MFAASFVDCHSSSGLEIQAHLVWRGGACCGRAPISGLVQVDRGSWCRSAQPQISEHAGSGTVRRSASCAAVAGGSSLQPSTDPGLLPARPTSLGGRLASWAARAASGLEPGCGDATDRSFASTAGSLAIGRSSSRCNWIVMVPSQFTGHRLFGLMVLARTAVYLRSTQRCTCKPLHVHMGVD